MDVPTEVRAAAMRALMVPEREMVESVARALLAQDKVATERAAKIAESEATKTREMYHSSSEMRGVALAIADHIASAIRSQP